MATVKPLPKSTSEVSEPSERFLTRAEAADLLGVSVHAIIEHERVGRLHAKWFVCPDGLGRLRDTPMVRVADVIKLPMSARRKRDVPPSNPDELCARAFEMFEQGKNIKQAVIELRATYQKIAEIHEQWRDACGVALEISEAIKPELVEVLGPFDSCVDLVTLVRKRCAT